MPTCSICGEPMPPGEEMFKFHGYSGDCPKPPLQRTVVAITVGIRERQGQWFAFMGDAEIACYSRQEAERIIDDMNAMVKQSGGDVLPPHVQ